jgi:hypothetical protein
MATSLRTTIDDARASAVPSSATMPQRKVVLALARIEAKQMLRHPAFLLTIAFGLLLTRGAVGLGPDTDVAMNLVWLFGGLIIGTLIGSVLTTNVAALRGRRDHVLELFGSLPSPPEARTAGVLAGMVIGLGGASLVLAAIAWPVLERISDTATEADLFLAVQYPLSVLALGSVGVAVARWIPSVLGGPLVVIAHVFTGMMWAVPWIAPTDSDIGVAWHLAYLVAVIVACSVAAFLRDRRTIARWIVTACAFALAVIAAMQQTPPGGY